MVLRILAAALVFCALSANAAQTDKARLQAAMQLHLEAMSLGGTIHHLDEKAGDFIELYATQAHPMIFQVDRFFVLCSELVTAEGERRTIDVYITEHNGALKVVQTIIGDRRALKKLMSTGRTVRL